MELHSGAAVWSCNVELQWSVRGPCMSPTAEHDERRRAGGGRIASTSEGGAQPRVHERLLNVMHCHGLHVLRTQAGDGDAVLGAMTYRPRHKPLERRVELSLR